MTPEVHKLRSSYYKIWMPWPGMTPEITSHAFKRLTERFGFPRDETLSQKGFLKILDRSVLHRIQHKGDLVVRVWRVRIDSHNVMMIFVKYPKGMPPIVVTVYRPDREETLKTCPGCMYFYRRGFVMRYEKRCRNTIKTSAWRTRSKPGQYFSKEEARYLAALQHMDAVFLDNKENCNDIHP
jgi:hypothetical protein